MSKGKHVVKYPSNIKKRLLTIEDLEEKDYFKKTVAILKKAQLPKGTLFDTSYGDDTAFTIVLPDGRAFTGYAFKKKGDEDNPKQAFLTAAGRALAVWKRCCFVSVTPSINTSMHNNLLNNVYRFNKLAEILHGKCLSRISIK